jgi:quercetin 2,3-dioxygenase
MSERTVQKIWKSRPTMEGAGVRLHRAFGNAEAGRLDPFLLLDDFYSDDPDDYLAGFPWHPHRGIETVTYMIHGSVAHEDSMGNKGVISDGDVQWMTAGSGIVHSEMPRRNPDYLRGLQLWVNLPSSHKMMPPRYRDITRAMIPVVELKDGVKVRIICGEIDGVKGPALDIVASPEYLDVEVPGGAHFTRETPTGHTVFAYVLEGDLQLPGDRGQSAGRGTLVLCTDGTSVRFGAGDDGARYLLVSGKPLREPIAWAGPIVMNTDDELKTAFEEYRNGTFLKG